MSAERDQRLNELQRATRTSLAAVYRETCGYVGGARPPETWRRDELINEILRTEFPTEAVRFGGGS